MTDRSVLSKGLIASSLGLCLWLAACRPYADDLDIRAMDFVRTAIVTPDDGDRLHKIAANAFIDQDRPVSVAFKFLWARHRQGATLSYTISLKRELDARQHVIMVLVSEDDKNLLGQPVNKYLFDVYFERDEAGAWRITRLRVPH